MMLSSYIVFLGSMLVQVELFGNKKRRCTYSTKHNQKQQHTHTAHNTPYIILKIKTYYYLFIIRS